MDLLHTGLLYLLPLAAVPVLLHLLSLHRLRTVELSTFRFLFASYVQQRRRMRFLEALIAALRTLFLLLLIFAVARPVISHWSGIFASGAGNDVVMLVDCSASMNAQSGGVSSLDRAKEAATKIAQRLGPDDHLTLLRVAARPEEAFSRFSADAPTIQDSIDSLRTSPGRANLFAALIDAFQGRSEKGRPLVYFFTDGQACTWRELSEQSVERLLPAKARLVVVNVASHKELANVAVVGTPPPREQAIVGLPVRLVPRVVNTSKTRPAEVTLSVFINEKEIARRPLALKAGETFQPEVIYTPTEAGVLRGRFEINRDRFPDDDRYLFAFSVAPQIRVLLVNGSPSPDPFENETLYLRTALTSNVPEVARPQAAVASGPTSVEAVKSLQRSLDVVEVPEGTLNPQTLHDASVVVLANCGSLNAQQYAWLRDFVMDGGGLVIFPGDRVTPGVYNAQFFLLPGPLKQKMLPLTLQPAEGDAQKFDTFRRFELVDYTHPVLSVFDDPKARYLTTANFYRRFPLAPDDPAPGLWSLAGFSAKQPALVEARFGDGVILLAAFPATARWSNLPLKPEFVPLVLRMVNRAARRPEMETPSVVLPEALAEVTVTAAWAPVTARVLNVDGVGTELSFERVGSRLIGAFERTVQQGYYTVEGTGGTPTAPKGARGAFAVNLAPEESQLTLVAEDDVRRWLPGVELSMVDATAEAQQEFGAIGQGHEIWRFLLALTFLAIGVEFLLATLSGRRAEGEESAADRIRRVARRRWFRWPGRGGSPRGDLTQRIQV